MINARPRFLVRKRTRIQIVYYVLSLAATHASGLLPSYLSWKCDPIAGQPYYYVGVSN